MRRKEMKDAKMRSSKGKEALKEGKGIKVKSGKKR